jgi:outer membrane protein
LVILFKHSMLSFQTTKTILISLGVKGLLLFSPLQADDSLPVISLSEALRTTLSEYLGIELERFSLLQASTSLQIARAQFDTRLALTGTLSERQSPRAASELDGAANPLNQSRSLSTSLQRRVATGGALNLQGSLIRSESNSAFAALNPDYSSEVSLSLRQPLLRDRGPAIARNQIRNAETDVVRSRLAFQRAILGLLADVEIFYYNVAFAQARLDLRLSSKEIAQILLEENTQREAVGLATRIDVLQAESALATRREEVIQAEQDLRNAREALINITGGRDLGRLYRVEPLPDSMRAAPTSDNYLQAVVDFDLEGRIQRTVIEQRERNARVARNSLLPNLDLILRGGYLGREGSLFDSIQETIDRRGYLWNAGLELSVPWGRREGRARAFLAEADLQREESRLSLVNQNTLVRARSALRAFETGLERIISSDAAVLLNQEVFQRERARYESGLATFRAVLEAQQDLDNARFRRLQAQFDTLRAGIDLSLLDGSLPDRQGLEEELLSLLFSDPM